MEFPTNLAMEDLLNAWVHTLIRQLRRIVKNGMVSQPTDLLNDLQQFQAIGDQLQMLLSARPSERWARYVWRQNFHFYLVQLSHRTHHCLRHLSNYAKNS